MNPEVQTHLGDGVYAHFDGYHIVLDTPYQPVYNKIYLEPAVLHSLDDYQKRLQAHFQAPKESPKPGA